MMGANMLRYLLKSLILCFCLFSVVVHAEETEYERMQREASEKQMNRMKEELELMDVDIRFYGKVVDQYQSPVEGAEILLLLTRFSPDIEKLFGDTDKVNAKTDMQGCFSFTGLKGSNIFIKLIRKEGYEFSIMQNPVAGYEYSGVRNPFIPDPTNPVVFHMRKMGETTFLIKESDLELELGVDELGKSVGVDLVSRHKIKNLSNPIMNGERLVCDLKMAATFNETNKIWSIVLMPGDTNGGIIASDQLLYEAPQDGYQPEFAFTAEDHKLPANKYIYLRSRDPAIYTRFEIEFATVGDDFVRVSGNSSTNPYGERNLERATDLPYAVYNQLYDEIETAFRQNKRPIKPDLKKLINEAKGKTSQ
jgi:hypothetical protein